MKYKGAEASQAQELLNHSVQLLSIHNEKNEWNLELEYLDSRELIRNMKRFTDNVETTDSACNCLHYYI